MKEQKEKQAARENILSIENKFEAELAARTKSSLPLSQYAYCALKHVRREDNLSPITTTNLFRFCRLLKAHPEVENADAGEALRLVLGFSQDKNLLPLFPGDYADEEECRNEFCNVWDVIRFPIGSDPVDAAIQSAREIPFIPARQMTESYQKVVSVAGWLQRFQGRRNIFLPCDLLSRKLGWSKMTISRAIHMAERNRLLVRVKPHDNATGSAAEFRFALERFMAEGNEFRERQSQPNHEA